MALNAGRPAPEGRTLLEREAELSAVERRLALLCGDRDGADHGGALTGGVLTFAGPAGSGKTALLAEAGARAAARGCTVLRACGGEQEQESAFHVVRQLVRPLLATAGEGGHRALLGAWYDLLAPAVGLTALSDDGRTPDPQGVRDGLDRLLARFAVPHAPLVLLVDDAHWTDPASLAWLTGCAALTDALPLLLLTGYSPGELPVGAAGFRRFTEHGGQRPHTLAPLSTHAVTDLVGRRLGDHPDAAFCRECQAVTGGSPFEVTELVALAYDGGLKPQQDNVPRISELARAVKGDGFIDRLQRLGLPCVRLSWAVAVLGTGATLRLAASVAALGIDEARHAAGTLRAARVLRPQMTGAETEFGTGTDRIHGTEHGQGPGAGYGYGHPEAGEPLEFSHPLLAATVYRAIPDSLRTALHGQAAASVVAAGRGVTASARHLLEIHPDGDPAVVEELRQAARAHLSAGAPEAAHRCLGRALREPPPLRDRPRVLYELGCSALPHAPAATVNHLRAALEEPELDSGLRALVVHRLAQALGRTERMGEAVRTAGQEALRATDTGTRLRMRAEQFLWSTFHGGSHDDGVSDGGCGCDRDGVGDSEGQNGGDREHGPGRSRGLDGLSGLSGIPGLSGLAAEVLAAAPAERGMAGRYLLGLRGWDAVVRGEPAATALVHAEEALGDGLSWTDEEWGFEVPVLVALTFLYCDRPGRAEELFRLGIAECERAGLRGSHLASGLALLGLVRHRRGRLADAEELVRTGLRIAGRTGSEIPPQWCAPGILIEILLARGEVDEAWRTAERHAYGEATRDVVVHPDPSTVYAGLLLSRGHREEAGAKLMAAGQWLEPRGMRNPAWCPWQLRLAEALATTEHARAVRTADEAVERARRFGAPSALGQALHASALLRTGPARLELLRAAVGHLERAPAARELAAALVALGAALREAGLAGEAAGNLHRGLEGAVRCGATPLAARARDELAAAGLPQRPPAGGSDGGEDSGRDDSASGENDRGCDESASDDGDTLTAQERTVADLAGRGTRVADIAREMGVREAAIGPLLSGVCRKLGTDLAGLHGPPERGARQAPAGHEPGVAAPGGD
ncbi:AAA family ATPase [Streptomyces iconiensis]|uniref:AAA family ATPase n=1 Tax=Streptomyces iconiensis TaxID=1384038 RepID=A0ABT7A730_9ACTN|nr:AAA family ATPase [Streptomyces iconiensis]MDJ1137145.1 AAA family ATPase [Streptomyces iconiensis]